MEHSVHSVGSSFFRSLSYRGSSGPDGKRRLFFDLLHATTTGVAGGLMMSLVCRHSNLR